MNQSIASEEREEKNFSEYLATIIHYRHLVIVTTILLVLVSIVVAYLLPSSYKSEGLILIESQEIPTNLIKSTVTSYASQRIEMIKQRAMTTDKVMEMVEKFDLYPTLRQQAPLSEIVNLFRDNVNIEMLEANVTDPYSGRAKKATIAFTISFLDSQPKTAQYVTNELITEFLDENIKTRTHRAMETTLFLDEEAGKLQRKVRLLEQQIAGFKEKYKESLPELLQFNLSSIERLQEELTANQKQIIQLKDKIAITTLEYTNLKQYIASQERDQYSDSDMEMDLATAEIKLSQLLSKYSTEHPDVKKIKSHITRLKSGDSLNTPLQMKANDPVILQLESKVTLAKREIARLRNRAIEINEKLASYEARVIQTHQVQRQYDELVREHAQHIVKYQEMKSKKMEAELAQNLESENKGESFTLIEPPRIPVKPEKPNRKKFLLVGVIMSLMTGISLALLIEKIIGGVRGEHAMTRLLANPPIAVIPMMYSEEERRKSRHFNLQLMLGFVAMIGMTLLGSHYWLIPLDLIWLQMMSNFSL